MIDFLCKKVFLGLGSNVKNKRYNIIKATNYLKILKKSKMKRRSSIYISKPMGFQRQKTFMNAVVEIETSLSIYDLLREVKKIEKKLGRRRTFKNGPRIIDIDILIYEKNEIDRIHLKIPHPRISRRPFVLVPLYEICSDLKFNIYSYDCMKNSTFKIFKCR